MRFNWLQVGEEVEHLDVGPEQLRRSSGRLAALPREGAEAEVDFAGERHRVPVWRLKRRGERPHHRLEQLAPGLRSLTWEGYENNGNAALLGTERPLLVDPGHAHLLGSLLTALAEASVDAGSLGVILCTHSHPDHIEAAEPLALTGAPIGMHPQEREYLRGGGALLYRFFGCPLPEIDFSISLDEGPLEVAGLRLEVVHTPGHSPGSVCLYWPEHKALIGGDLVFEGGSFGRCDFPGGSYPTLLDSVRKVQKLDTEFLLPGHGGAIAGAKAVAASLELSARNLQGMVFGL